MSEATDSAYQLLRDRIYSGAHKPGERLKERTLCAELKVSRTPVREALRRLEADGLVVISPRRGAEVATIRPDELAEIYSLGAELESFAAKLAAQRATPENLAQLDQIMAEMRLALARNDDHTRADYLRLDNALHRLILEMADNRHLAAVLKQIVGVPVLVQAFNQYSIDDMKHSYEQHRNIVAALHQGNDEWAQSAMRSHILAAGARQVPPADQE